MQAIVQSATCPRERKPRGAPNDVFVQLPISQEKPKRNAGTAPAEATRPQRCTTGLSNQTGSACWCNGTNKERMKPNKRHKNEWMRERSSAATIRTNQFPD